MSAAADALMGIFGFKRVESEMKTVEETRRAAFEAYVKTANADDYAQKGERLFDWNGATYVWTWVNWDWLLWSAALDAVEIELPREVEMKSSQEFDHGIEAGYSSALEDVRAAIESINLGIKIL